MMLIGYPAAFFIKEIQLFLPLKYKVNFLLTLNEEPKTLLQVAIDMSFCNYATSQYLVYFGYVC